MPGVRRGNSGGTSETQPLRLLPLSQSIKPAKLRDKGSVELMWYHQGRVNGLASGTRSFSFFVSIFARIQKRHVFIVKQSL